MRKIVLIFSLLLTVVSLSGIQFVQASPGEIWVPYDYLTIQAAVNAANPGDVIHVTGGPYYEHVVVNKSVSLIGENNVMINGSQFDYIFEIQADQVVIKNFNLYSAKWDAVHLIDKSKCIIENNQIVGCGRSAMYIEGSSDIEITKNIIRNCVRGVVLIGSSYCKVKANSISVAQYGVEIRGILIPDGENWFNEISQNNITDCSWYGIYARLSFNSTYSGNWITSNDVGIALYDSANNTIFHNNFVNNAEHARDDSASTNNMWCLEWPVGGNYWDNYTGIDVHSGIYQNQPESDGIGDTPYYINVVTIDKYPLMGSCNTFEVSLIPTPTLEKISIISNSSISAFQISETERTIRFNVTGEDGIGFCRVDIPNLIVESLWAGNYTVKIDNAQPLYMRNWTENAQTYLYFTYQHSTHQVTIIPEFPSSTTLLGFLVLITLLSVLTRKKHNKTLIITSTHLSLSITTKS